LKVLHIITGLGVGGAEMQLRSILQHTRHDCDVVTLYNPGPVAEMIRGDGARVGNVGMTRNTQLSVLPKLRRIIASGGYDVVHCHLYRSQIYGRPAAWLAGVPVIVTTEHSIGETHLERREMTTGVRALYLATERLSDATIAVSQTVRERMINWGVRDSRIVVIPNGVDLDRVAFDAAARARIRAEFGIGTGDYVIGVLGRLDPNKQFDLVIEASAALLGDGVKLMVVGKGAEQSHLEEVAARCEVTGQVIFTGERHDVSAMLSAMDLFVASSAQETFGLSVLEALANGAPVLYTTCPALTGLEVSRAQQVPSTVAGLRAAMAQEVAAGARDRLPEPAVEKEYGISAVTTRLDDLYEQLAARRRWRTLARGLRRRATAVPAPDPAAPDPAAPDLDAPDPPGPGAPPATALVGAAASEPAAVNVPASPAQTVKGQQ
jgi:glycosyltransferase involved in cell wall biosynthesis